MARCCGPPTNPGRSRRTASYSVVQLYRRDFPGLLFLRGTDLVQVLVCPGGTLDGPDAHVVWRNAGEVTAVTEQPPPQPVYDDEHYTARPCVLHPCEIDEHPLSTSFAQGCKIGGWSTWYGGRPHHLLRCPTCTAPRQVLLALGTYEYPHESCTCVPRSVNPAGWKFGSLGALYVFVCSHDPRHPAMTFED